MIVSAKQKSAFVGVKAVIGAGVSAALLALTGTANAAPVTIYSTTFSSGTELFTGGGVAAVTPSGERYLELYNGNASTLTLNTSGYTGLMASFNLYGIQSVDGNGPQGGAADPFEIYVNGAAVPTYNINIANFGGGNTQSYNGNLSQSGAGFSYAPLTGAIATGTLGYGTGSYGDSTYLVSFALPDSAITSITLLGRTNENSTDPNGSTAGNEAYGVDNFVLSGTANAVVTPIAGAAPEPATWAMMILGFGLAGLGLRHRVRRSEVKFDAKIKQIAEDAIA